MSEFLIELWSFMKERKKFWLLPIVLCLVRLAVCRFHIGNRRGAVYLHAFLIVSCEQ